MDNTNRQPKFSLRNKFTTSLVYMWTNEKWASINQRTINGKYAKGKCASHNPQQQSYLNKGIRLDMDVVEFYDYCSDNEVSILAMIGDNMRPSIDRIDDAKGYSLDNIQIIPLIDNITKGKAINNIVYDKLTYQLRNRRQYLQGQNYQVSVPLVVDYYFNLTKDFKHSIKLVKELVNKGIINDPFQKVNGNTIYNDEGVTIINKAIAEYEDKLTKEKELKDAKLNTKADHIIDKQLQLAEKRAKLEITKSDRYVEVYKFIRLRKHALQLQANDCHKAAKVCNLDARILSEKTKDLAIDVVANNISIEVKSIKELRAEQPKPTHRNISWDSVACLYIAEFTKNKIKHFVGRYETEAEAVIALITAKTKLEGERA